MTGIIGVLGASGGTGGVIVRQLLDADRHVRAAVRSADAARRLEAAGAEVVRLDLTTSSNAELVAAFAGLDAIINAAAASSVTGIGARRVDRDGVGRAVAAAEQAGVPRWIQLSMMGADNPKVVPLFLRRVASVKGQADANVTRSGLRWTVIRPPWLTDGTPSGRIALARNLTGGSITRGDVAGIAIACLDEPATERRVFDVASGTTPVHAALAAAAQLT
jgi:uncharacterized protein YbjT (DUF2867 family)